MESRRLRACLEIAPTRELLARSLLAAFLITCVSGTALPDEPEQPPWKYSSELLRPFWQGDTARGETVLFIKDPATGKATASVFYPVREILSVRHSANDVTYLEGRDYRWEPGSREITLPANSRIVSYTPAELRRPAGSQKHRLTHRDGDGEILFGATLEYHNMQTCITYKHEPEAWKSPVPTFDGQALPRTIRKLRDNEPVSVVLIGDSISTGCNASGWAGGTPFQPAFPGLLRLHLEASYETQVRITNLSVGGQSSGWMLSMIDKIVEPRPDLVIVAFGMNDAAGRSAKEYQANTKATLTKVRERLPDAEFILVASMLGNRDWTVLQQELFPQYRDSLAELCEPGIALADVTSVWTEFLKRKQDWDMTGNGVNHPNDFGHRVYAQVLSSLLVPPEDAVQATEPEVHAQSQPSSPLRFHDAAPQHYKLSARASKVDSRVKAHPEIGFFIETKSGQPADVQHASVDTRVAPRGKLVIWLMGHNEQLFDRINSYGLHAIRVHYANRWFSTCCREQPVGEHCRGNLRLEAATGQDFSDDVDIPLPDGMMERAYQFVKWLAKKNPQAGWDYFLTNDGTGLRWDDVIISGSSHGSTTAARFAKFQKVSRVVAFCGPRDQLQSWQSLPSATPENRYFGFSHVLDGGWAGDHYCRSWELIGMHKYGPIVNVDEAKTPYGNTRRLITDFDVGGDASRAHSSVVPGSRAKKDSTRKGYGHEDVWRYLFTQPVDVVGEASPMDNSCEKNQRR